MVQNCFGHLNGFEHLELHDGVDHGFDLGSKWERRDARRPFWILFVSYSSLAGPRVEGTLQFALAASSLPDESDPPSVEQDILLKRAAEHVGDALTALKGGKTPSAARSVQHI